MIFKNKKSLLLLLPAAIVGYIIYDSTSQPTVNDLEGRIQGSCAYTGTRIIPVRLFVFMRSRLKNHRTKK